MAEGSEPRRHKPFVRTPEKSKRLRDAITAAGISVLSLTTEPVAYAQSPKREPTGISRPSIEKETALRRKVAGILDVSEKELQGFDVEMPIECNRNEHCILHLGQIHQSLTRIKTPPKLRAVMIANQKAIGAMALNLWEKGSISCLYAEAYGSDFVQALPGLRAAVQQMQEQINALNIEMNWGQQSPKATYGEWSLKRVEYLLKEFDSDPNNDLYHIFGRDLLEKLPVLQERVFASQGNTLSQPIRDRFEKAKVALDEKLEKFGEPDPWMIGAASNLYLTKGVPLICASETKETNQRALQAFLEKTEKIMKEIKGARENSQPRKKTAEDIADEKVQARPMELLGKLMSAQDEKERAKIKAEYDIVAKKAREIDQKMVERANKLLQDLTDPDLKDTKGAKEPLDKHIGLIREGTAVQMMTADIREKRYDKFLMPIKYGSAHEFQEAVAASNALPGALRKGLIKLVPKM